MRLRGCKFIRRLHEAQSIAWRRSRTPPNLARKLKKTTCPPGERQAVHAYACGLAIQLAADRRWKLQEDQRVKALQHWRRQMQGISQACKWLCKEEAAPNAVRDADPRFLFLKFNALIVE